MRDFSLTNPQLILKILNKRRLRNPPKLLINTNPLRFRRQQNVGNIAGSSAAISSTSGSIKSEELNCTGERKILLQNLSGNGSFKSGERRQPEQTASAELTEDAAETHLENIACETGTDDLAETLTDAELIHGVNALRSGNGEEVPV